MCSGFVLSLAQKGKPQILFRLFAKELEIVTFANHIDGRMAERLRQRSAKPSTPVRIRFRPQLKELLTVGIQPFELFFI